uniref:Chemosensory protein 29 n=1 Tax=Cnaphalocrocis medinalis TaxID=437488 RepID=A0A0U3AKE8_CNAME|nr:chemosensory protein 29 [Cnaphalocrocis medinalis]
MKCLLLVLAITIQCTLAQSATYTDRYDTINLDDVLANKRLTVAYIKCVLDKGKCTNEGKELKSHIIEALQNGCSKCTKAQREGMRRVIRHLIKYEKGYWQELVEKYDPDRVFTQKYEKELNSI